MTDSAHRALTEGFVPNKEAVEAWRTFPSDYEFALLDRWLQRLIGTPRDYEARLALNLVAQRKYLARRTDPPAEADT